MKRKKVTKKIEKEKKVADVRYVAISENKDPFMSIWGGVGVHEFSNLKEVSNWLAKLDSNILVKIFEVVGRVKVGRKFTLDLG